MVKELFAVIHEQLPNKKPPSCSLSSLNIDSCIGIDVLSLLQQMQYKQTLSKQNVEFEFGRMAQFCTRSGFRVLMILEEENKHDNTSIRTSSFLKGLETKMQRLDEKLQHLSLEEKTSEDLKEAKRTVYLDKKARIQEQLQTLQKRTSSSSTASLVEFCIRNKYPYVLGDRKYVIPELFLRNKIQYLASEENQTLIPLALVQHADQHADQSHKSLLRNFVWHVRSPTRFLLQQYEMSFLLTQMNLNSVQFLEICFLLGYQDLPTFPGLGKKRIYTGIQTFHTIEKFLASKKTSIFVDEKAEVLYLNKLKEARQRTQDLWKLNNFATLEIAPSKVTPASSSSHLYDIEMVEEEE